MNNKIEEIMNDLFAIEPTLKEREPEVREIVAKLLESRPDVQIDEVFLAELKSKLTAEAELLTEAAPKAVNGWSGWFNNRFAFAAVVAAITLIVALPAITIVSRQAGKLSFRPGPLTSDLFITPKTSRLAANAFGSLQGLIQETAGTAGRGGGGGGGVAPLAATPQSTAPIEGLGGGAGDAKIGILPYYQNYEYKYIGEPLTGLDAEAPVYKRVKDLSLGQQYARAFTVRRLGYFDLGRLQNLELASLNFNENREFGYSVYFSLYDNSFGLSANWEKWPHPERECRDEACFQRYQLKIYDIPSDNELIAIANSFLREYGIDLSAYGQPVVNKYWEREIQNMPDPANYYVPETVTVVYPLIIDGKSVKDEGGNPAGVYVDVNIRHKRGYGINNLFVPSFERSDYAAVTDAAEIIKLAENGGSAWLWKDPNASETVTLELGTPTVELIRYWWYDQTKPAAGGQELYIPALVFPIVNRDQAKGFWRDNVTVPLVQEIFDSLKTRDNGNIGIPEPMTFIKADGGEVKTLDSEMVEAKNESLPLIAPER